MDASQLKREAFQFCEVVVNTRLETIKHTIKTLQESLTSETKSSAGDKHETGRAQLQLEREKLGVQLSEVQKMQRALAKIDPHKSRTKIGVGALVITNQARYFIAISAGPYLNVDPPIYCISIATPMGQVLAEKNIGDEVVFNGKVIKIKAVF